MFALSQNVPFFLLKNTLILWEKVVWFASKYLDTGVSGHYLQLAHIMQNLKKKSWQTSLILHILSEVFNYQPISLIKTKTSWRIIEIIQCRLTPSLGRVNPAPQIAQKVHCCSLSGKSSARGLLCLTKSLSPVPPVCPCVSVYICVCYYIG